jgi:uncharacterized RDD family membrane protein YckC
MSPRAGLPRRLAASLYEALLLAALAVLVGFALLPVSSPGPSSAQGALPLPGPFARALSFTVLFAVLGAYCVWGWSGGRRTLPMKTWRIAMESASGSQVSVARAALRYCVWWVGPILAVAVDAALRPSGYRRWALTLLALNYAWALLDPDRQFLHDRLARTRLILAG